jgi:hypothetical protein
MMSRSPATTSARTPDAARPKLYAGIGARATPPEICELMTRLAERLAADGWTCRTGGAPGADHAFKQGAGELLELYLPWPRFQGHEHTRIVKLTSPNLKAYEIGRACHPAWERLDWKARALLARDVHQVLGVQCNDPVAMLVCWTPDGAISGEETTPETGGTGMAIRVASRWGAPVRNLQRDDHRTAAERYLRHV